MPSTAGDKESLRRQRSIQPYSESMVVYVGTEGRSHLDPLGHWHFEAVGDLREVTDLP